MSFYFRLLFLHLLGIIVLINSKSIVQIKQGKLKGIIEISRNGRNYSAFLGIPYGEPPIGKLRFSKPEPAKNWSGIRSAEEFGNACPQIDKNILMGEEDCLFLNVYTPFLNFERPVDKLLPVMFWIHGGYFMKGSSNDYSANYFLDKEIILVTINYRLGIFGFLSTGDKVAPGNFGMKDQVLALKWVQENIEIFGGDPSRVTIFGESSGAVSANLHAISKASDGLFHQYIIESGSAVCPWAYQKRSKLVSHLSKISTLVQCPFNKSEAIIDCLRKTSVNKLLSTTTVFDTLSRIAQLTWTPTDEDNSDNAFLTDKPQNLINEMKHLPFIAGVNTHEGLLVTSIFYSNELLYGILKFMIKPLIGFVADYYFGTKDKTGFIAAVNKFYLNNSLDLKELGKNEYLKSITTFITDGFFLYPTLKMLQKVTPHMNNSNYAYIFAYRGEFSTTSKIIGTNRNIGVNHMDELIYLFSSKLLFTNNSYFELTGSDLFISKLMVDFWTSFASEGHPTSKELREPRLWKPFSTPKNTHLQIGNIKNNTSPDITFSNSLLPSRFEFWTKNCPFSL